MNILIFRSLLGLGLWLLHALHWLLESRDIDTNGSTLFQLVLEPPLPVPLICNVFGGFVVGGIQLRSLSRLLLCFGLFLLVPLVLDTTLA